jgi:hypothetical protein
MREFFIVSRWWDRLMGVWLRLRGRPRCARSPFEPAPEQDRTGQPPSV